MPSDVPVMLAVVNLKERVPYCLFSLETKLSILFLLSSRVFKSSLSKDFWSFDSSCLRRLSFSDLSSLTDLSRLSMLSLAFEISAERLAAAAFASLACSTAVLSSACIFSAFSWSVISGISMFFLCEFSFSVSFPCASGCDLLVLTSVALGFAAMVTGLTSKMVIASR